MSGVRELARIAFGRARKGWLVLLDLGGYFDASGKEGDHPIVTVGGFLATAKNCELIERDWEKATGGKLFHLVEFGTKDCKLGSHAWNREKRAGFLRRLTGIVNRPGCFHR